MKKTLLIIAAGMGSRYGSMKQIDPVGPSGESLIDYSMYDAIRAGFNKIVFVIHPSLEGAFREIISQKLEAIIETAYVCQKLDSCLGSFTVPRGREKPWGTGHAILAAQEVIKEPFVVINADDYYGSEAYQIMVGHLQKMAAGNTEEYAMVGYVLRNTLSEYGAVARGICQYNSQMYLTSVTERTKIRKEGPGAVVSDEQGKERYLTGDEIVSMNVWGFGADVFEFLQQQFHAYLREHAEENKHEFYLPVAVDTLVRQGRKKVRIFKTKDAWFGVTFPKDKQVAQARIRKLIEEKVYPEKLW